jgi:dihydroxy-acid dehydratase
MEDFHAAGGLPALLWELRDLLHGEALDITGKRLADRLAEPAFVDRRYIRERSKPVSPVGGLVALFGSLAPRGAILKRSAATPDLFEREARAVVFDGLEDLANLIDDPALDVTQDDMLVLKNAGPLTPAGMPEAGYLPIPGKLARAGVKDMVRISDCRMSGTAFGTIVLHVTPEAAAGGPLALVESGDRIRLSVKGRRIDLLVPEDVLARRRAAWVPPSRPARGWDRLVADQVLQADEGCDLAVLRGAEQAAVE